MKKYTSYIRQLTNQQGVTAIIVAIMMVMFLGFAALAVDIGFLMWARNQCQNAADAAALAGARLMGNNYYVNVARDQGVVDVARTVAAQNAVAGRNPVAANVDTQIGTWGPPFVTGSPDPPNAVQVSVRREGTGADGAITTFFAQSMGIGTLNVGATAVAALSGPCEAKPSIPLGIGRSWFDNVGANRGCTQIAVNDTYKSCAGWTNLSSAKFKWQDADAMIVDPTTIPTMDYGDVAEFGNGTVTPLLTDLLTLFNAKKIPDPTSPSGYSWTTSAVVFEDYDVCEPPNRGYKVLGFATVKIEDIITSGSDKGLYGVVQCSVGEEKRGGCFYAGTYGTIPGLVE